MATRSLDAVRRVSILSSASGSGKTTLGRELSVILGAPFVELDALVHGPGWVETPTDALLATLEPTLAEPRWVVDGNYRGKIGDAVISRADLVVWLDLPMSVWLPRLLLRTARRTLTREPLWNGNRETLRSVVFDHDSVVRFAVRHFHDRRAHWSVDLSRFPCVRLCAPSEVRSFVLAMRAVNAR